MAKTIKDIKKDIKAQAVEEGFDFSEQALHLLSKTDKPIDYANDLIALAKSRQFKVAGGDVIKYLIKKDLPISISGAGDRI